MSNSSSHVVDLASRPRSYFWANDFNISLSSSIKGVERKLLHERGVAQGDDSFQMLAKPSLSSDERTAWGRLHPRCMGGEYLPDVRTHEVEIARIAIASTTQDVTSVYAKARKGRIHYRVVDEYGGDTLSSRSARTSIRPLTLGELVDFFLGAWDLTGVLAMNFEEDGYPQDEVHGFITDASSSFYAEFGAAIEQRVDAWLATVAAKGREQT